MYGGILWMKTEDKYLQKCDWLAHEEGAEYEMRHQKMTSDTGILN